MTRAASIAFALVLLGASAWAGTPPAGADRRPKSAAAPNRAARDTSAAREDRAPAPPRRLEAFDPTQVAPPVARLDSAEIYYAWGDYASVVRLLGDRSAARPREQLLLGWSQYRLGHMREAIAAFEAGMALAPDNLDLLNGHAFALYRTGESQRAEAGFRRILERNPDREESIRGLAVVLYTSDRFAECVPMFDRVLRGRPSDAEAQRHLARSVDGMLCAWRAAGRTLAEMADEAWRLAEAGNSRAAFEIFTWVLLQDPFHPGARLGLGTLGAEFGREPEAQRCLQDLLRENPADARAHVALARLHLGAGRTQEASAQVAALLAARPGDAQGLELQREIESRARSHAP